MTPYYEQSGIRIYHGEALDVEREEKYCEMAAERLSQEALPMEFSA